MSDVERVGEMEWEIAAIEDGWVRLQPRRDDPTPYWVPAELLPEDVRPGDRFSVVAELDRRRRDEMPDACVDALAVLREMKDDGTA